MKRGVVIDMWCECADDVVSGCNQMPDGVKSLIKWDVDFLVWTCRNNIRSELRWVAKDEIFSSERACADNWESEKIFVLEIADMSCRKK